MAEAFKEFFNQATIEHIAKRFCVVAPQFDQAGFIAMASNNLAELELKQRSEQIADSLVAYLPDDVPQAVQSTLAVLGERLDEDDNLNKLEQEDGIRGFAVMPLCEVITKIGCNEQHFELAMDALKQLTSRFSSEFAIRPFIDQFPQQSFELLLQWTTDDCHHVRRLASEGARPRLPWGMQLKQLVKQPEPLKPILTALKNDDSEYVRRSVANNINDIAKDHPAWVCELCQSWLPDTPESQQSIQQKNRVKLVRHALRTLFKQGYQPALSLFGYLPVKLMANIELAETSIQFGTKLLATISIDSDSDRPQDLMVDYVIYHQKANGKLAEKVFKYKKLTLKSKQKFSADLNHHFKPITTRKYYDGLHQIALKINGEVFAVTDFTLQGC